MYTIAEVEYKQSEYAGSHELHIIKSLYNYISTQR